MNQSKSTRRDFLKTTAAVTAASMAAPYFFTATAGRPTKPKSDKLTVAAIGVGGRGTDIGRQAAGLGNMVACADVHLGNANNFAGGSRKISTGKCKVYQDYRKVLDRKDVQAVTIGTPDHWHVKVAIDAMTAGKDVYCEKPLTLTIDEGNLICEAVKKYGKTLPGRHATAERVRLDVSQGRGHRPQRSPGHEAHARSVPSARPARAAPTRTARTARSTSTEPPKELDWDFWLGQAPEVDFCPERIGWNFRWWFDYSGGQVTDWGVHHTDIAFWALAGKDGQVVSANPIKSEFSMVPREKVLDFLLGKVPAKDMPQAYNVVRSFDVDLTLSTGNVIKLISGPNELLIVGEKGKIRVNRERLTGKPVEKIDADPKAKEEIEKLMAEIYGDSLENARRGHMANFFDCIRTGKLPVANVFDHVRAVNACHFANISLLTNRKIDWDPQAKEFKGDDDANALRTRKQREKYAIVV